MHIPLAASIVQWLLPSLLGQEATQRTAGSSRPTPSSIEFRPAHAFAHAPSNISRSPHLLMHNATASTSYLQTDPAAVHLKGPGRNSDTSLSIRTIPMVIRRPRRRPPTMLAWAYSARRDRPNHPPDSISTQDWVAPNFEDANGEWDDVEVQGPDIGDRQTLIALAKITSNAYVMPDGGEWWPVGDWNATVPFGWENDADGMRGHVFADPTNSTVIISIKGTSAGLLGSGGPTAKNDKFNDNLLFSCCCARVDFSWSTVCDCYAGGYRCEQTCIEDALVKESVYATVATNLYNNVSYMYPNAEIWLAGHSLGGSVSSLIGLSFGAPTVTFEAPGDHMPAQRLHLPLPPGMPAEKTGITHVYHTADPIPMGACTGAYSGCYATGFAMESRCHTGQTILYDTVTVKGWAVDVRTHRIGEIINKVLVDPWPTVVRNSDPERAAAGWLSISSWWGWGRKGPKRGQGSEPNGDEDWERHGGVPTAEAEADCVDCYRWEFGDGWNDKPKNSSG